MARAFAATWGQYRITLFQGIYGWEGRIHVAAEPGQPAVASTENVDGAPFPTREALVRWAVAFLQENGCGALVNGQRQPLEHFLVFTPSGLTTIP